MRWRALALSLALGCAPGPIVLPVPELPMSSVVVAEIEGETVVALRVFEGGLPNPLELEGGRAVRLMGYERSLAEEIAIDADGSATLAAREVPDAEALPLLTPTRAFELDERGVRELDAIAPWLASFRVARPPCPPFGAVTPIETWPGTGEVGGIVWWGDELAIGLGPDDEVDAAILVLDPRTLEARALALPRRFALHPPTPRPFVDGGRVHTLWEDNNVQTLLSLDRSGAIEARVVANSEHLRVGATAAGRVDDVGTVAVRARSYEHASPEEYTSKLFALDLAGPSLRLLGAGPPNAAELCRNSFESMILEVDGPGRGLAGLVAGRVGRFDAAGWAPTDYPDDLLCRSRRATVADGGELYLSARAQSSGINTAKTWWRPADGDWLEVSAVDTLTGTMLVAVGDFALAATRAGGVARFQVLRSRPERSPRYCGDVAVNLGAYHAVALDERRALVAGFGSTPSVRAAIVEVREP